MPFEHSISCAGRFGFVECRTEELATAGMQLDKVDLCGRHVNVGRPKGYVEPPGGAAAVPKLDLTQMFSGAAAAGLMPGLPGSGKLCHLWNGFQGALLLGALFRRHQPWTG